MIDRKKLIQALSDCIVAVFEQGLDEDEHFRTSLGYSYDKEKLSEISEEDINLAMQSCKGELKDLIFVMIDELINKD